MSIAISSSRSQTGGASAGGFKVDVSRGARIGRVSSEWFSRPDDERYLSLSDMHAAVRGRAERATARTVESSAVRVEAAADNPERLALAVPGRDAPIFPTHWSFGQLSSLVGAPSSYLRDLPAALVPTADNYLGRVTKARILEALREAKGDDAVDRIAHLKKGDMAAAAEKLLAGTGWLPEVLRTPGVTTLVTEVASEAQVDQPEVAVDTGPSADAPVIDQDDPDAQAIAAE